MANRKNGSPVKAVFIVAILFIITSFVIKIGNSANGPGKIDSAEDDYIYIVDEGKFFDKDAELLKTSMEEFYDRTGIVPILITDEVRDGEDIEMWENIPEEIYNGNYNDEAHWVIFYVASKTDNLVYTFYDYCGEDAAKLLTGKQRDDFFEFVDDNLWEGELSNAQSFSTAFKLFSERLIGAKVDLEKIISNVFGVMFFVVILIIAICSGNNKKKVKICPHCKKQVPVSAAMCPHCSSIISGYAKKDRVHDDHVDHGSHYAEEKSYDEDCNEHRLGGFFKKPKRGNYKYEDDDNSTYWGKDYE